MSKDRKGILTPNQEKGVDKLVELKGIAEKLDGFAIRLVDNQVIERAKSRIPEEYHPDVYEMVDELLKAFGVRP